MKDKAASPPAVDTPGAESEVVKDCHGLDTPDRVCFYEQDFYPLSNFSAFTLEWKGQRFDTSEAAYHWEKFPDHPWLQEAIRIAVSAHEAFKLAEQQKPLRRPDWDSVKVGIMREIIRAKAQRHEYVRRKLLATGERELVENSWRDDFWGWGPNRDGKNMLGKLWMEVRAELRAALSGASGKRSESGEVTAWLIERGQREHSAPTVWLNADTGEWEIDANKATKFPSDKAARDAAEDLDWTRTSLHREPSYSITEHVFGLFDGETK